MRILLAEDDSVLADGLTRSLRQSGYVTDCVKSGTEADTALARIRQNKVVTIGFRESAVPFAYLDERRQPSGYAIDICNKVVAEIGRKLAIPGIEARYVPVTPQTRIPLIANGTVDRMWHDSEFIDPAGAG